MNRLYIIDPVCVQPIGHNLPALQFFGDFAVRSDKFDDVSCYSAKSLALNTEPPKSITPHFTFMYGAFFSAKLSEEDEERRSEKARILKATSELDEILADTTATDTVLFPSIDYYSICAVIDWAGARDIEECPKIIVRMISVLEWVGATDKTGAEKQEICDRLAALINEGFPITVVAETPNYAQHLSTLLGHSILVAPYPPMYERDPIPAGRSTFTVSALGSARFDKGYLDLLEIFRTIVLTDPETSYRFRVQTLPNGLGSNHLKYTSALSAIPGVTLLRPYLSSEELLQEILQSDVLIGPYAPDVYKLRGSAMLMEAISTGRPFLSYTGCGFSSQVDYYCAGRAVSSISEMATEIVDIANNRRETINSEMAQARDRFEQDAISIYKQVML